MHTHHSHSGQFCQHAQNSLEQMVARAIDLGFTRFCMTEHMPRFESASLYPEEVASKTEPADLGRTFDEYYREAQRLKRKYQGHIEILVGFETEGISTDYFAHVKRLQDKYDFDLFVGSLHHVGGTPIDYSKALWEKARDEAGGVDELFCRYFDEQHAMIGALSPPVVGHFDLIRLFMPDYDLAASPAWPKVLRNIELAISRGCLFEVNTSALRKGWSTPYPQFDIAREVLKRDGHFCLSDDSHCVNQIALNYAKAFPYIQKLGEPLRSVGGPDLSAAMLGTWLETHRTQLESPALCRSTDVQVARVECT